MTTGADALAADIAATFGAVGFKPRSAVIYGSVAAGVADEDSDIDVLCVIHELPSDELRADLDDLVDFQFEARANISFMLVDEAEREAVDSVPQPERSEGDT